jgi:hypothetical protein
VSADDCYLVTPLALERRAARSTLDQSGTVAGPYSYRRGEVRHVPLLACVDQAHIASSGGDATLRGLNTRASLLLWETPVLRSGDTSRTSPMAAVRAAVPYSRRL